MKKNDKKRREEEELAYIRALCNGVQDENVSRRLCYLLTWYHEKAQHNRRAYHRFRSLGSLLPGIITLLSLLSLHIGDSIIGTIMAAISILITLINHRMEHYRYYENWIRYRSAAEQLKREAQLFLTGCEPYSGNGEESDQRRFMKTIETITLRELATWENLQSENQRTHLCQADTLYSGAVPEIGGNGEISYFNLPTSDR